jgi:hypothetical protein
MMVMVAVDDNVLVSVLVVADDDDEDKLSNLRSCNVFNNS